MTPLPRIQNTEYSTYLLPRSLPKQPGFSPGEGGSGESTELLGSRAPPRYDPDERMSHPEVGSAPDEH